MGEADYTYWEASGGALGSAAALVCERVLAAGVLMRGGLPDTTGLQRVTGSLSTLIADICEWWTRRRPSLVSTTFRLDVMFTNEFKAIRRMGFRQVSSTI
jgi:hypothetical protein